MGPLPEAGVSATAAGDPVSRMKLESPVAEKGSRFGWSLEALAETSNGVPPGTEGSGCVMIDPEQVCPGGRVPQLRVTWFPE